MIGGSLNDGGSGDAAVFYTAVCENFQQARNTVESVLQNVKEQELSKVLRRIEGHQKKIVAILPESHDGTALEVTIAWRKEKDRVLLFMKIDSCAHRGDFGVFFESKLAYHDLAVAFPKIKRKLFELCTRFLRMKGYTVPTPIVLYDYSKVLDAFAAYDERWNLWLITKNASVRVDTYPRHEPCVESLVIHLQRSLGLRVSLTKEALLDLLTLILTKRSLE